MDSGAAFEFVLGQRRPDFEEALPPDRLEQLAGALLPRRRRGLGGGRGRGRRGLRRVSCDVRRRRLGFIVWRRRLGGGGTDARMPRANREISVVVVGIGAPPSSFPT